MPEEDSVTDEINLTWGVPDDDGGYPITGLKNPICNYLKFKNFISGLLFMFLGYRVEMLDIQTGRWIEITFIEGYEPRCTLSNIL